MQGACNVKTATKFNQNFLILFELIANAICFVRHTHSQNDRASMFCPMENALSISIAFGLSRISNI